MSLSNECSNSGFIFIEISIPQKIICGFICLSTSWITKWLELINILILILSIFNRSLAHVFSFCSETSMGKGGQNNERKVLHFPASFVSCTCNFSYNVLRHLTCDIDVVALFSLCATRNLTWTLVYSDMTRRWMGGFFWER